MSELPASVRLALWATSAWQDGTALTGALTRSFPDLDHVSGDLARLDLWRDLGERALFVALPRPGDVSRMPRGSVPGSAHAADAGECVFVAGLGGLLVPTLSEFGPTGDVGVRADWTAYEADPVPRHQLEMLDLRQIERELLRSLRQHTQRFESVGGAPWGRQARSEAESSLDTAVWGLPVATPPKALHVMSVAATVSRLAELGTRQTGLGADGLDAATTANRTVLLRTLAGEADAALADATNVAVMALAGWRPA